MDRQDLESEIKNMYLARLENDADQCLAFYTADAKFEVAGLNAGPAGKAESVCDQINALVAIWRWESQSDLDIIVEGDNAAATYKLTAVHISSGHRAKDTRICDRLTFENGKIVKFTQYLDTGLIGEMMAKP